MNTRDTRFIQAFAILSYTIFLGVFSSPLLTSAAPRIPTPPPPSYALSTNDLIVTFYNPATVAQAAQLQLIPGTQVTQVSQHSFRIEITDQVNALAIGAFITALSHQGFFHVELNRPIQLALQIFDPVASWHTIVPTGIGTHAGAPLPGNLNAQTAFDLSQGASGVPIAVIDLNRDYNAALNPDMPSPAINVVTSLVAGQVPHTSYHADQVAAQVFALLNGIGTVGNCPGCPWYSYSVYTDLDPQGASQEPLLGALLDLSEQARLSNAKVVNLSWGSVPDSFAIETAVRALYDSGKIVVAAAGNHSAERPLTPARLPFVVSVGGINANPVTGELTLWSGSNRRAEIMAPSTNIPSPIVSPQFGVFYEGRAGTSYAAPQVSGIFGLLLSLVATQPAAYPITAAMSPIVQRDYMIDLVKRTATDMGQPGKDELFGHGLVHAYEAMRTLQADNRSSISTDLQQGFTEWRASSVALPDAAPFLPRYRARLQATTPMTEFSVLRSARHGECYVPGSYRFHSPSVTTSLNNTDITIAGVNNDEVQVVVSSDIDFSIRQRIDTAPSNPLSCILGGWNGHSFPVSWNGTQDNTRRAYLTYRLGANGYERIQTHAVGPLPTRIFQSTFPSISGPGSAGAQYAVFLSQVEPSLRLMEEAFNAELIAMADAVIDRTLTLDRSNVSSYTRKRTFQTTSPEQVLLPTLSPFENNPAFLHNATSLESVSQFGVRVSRSNYENGIQPAPALAPGLPAPILSSNADSTPATSENYLNAVLQNFYARGLFSLPYNGELDFLVETTTLDSLNQLTFHAQASALLPPQAVFYPSTTGGHIGEIEGLFDLALTIQNSGGLLYQSSLPVRFIVPFTNYDLYRDAPMEKDLGDRVTQFDQRVTFDYQAARVIMGDGSASSSAPISAGVPVRVGEVETLFKETLGSVVLRSLSALSTWESSGNKDVGSYGCILNLAGLLQQYGLSLNGIETLRLQDSRNCFDLNLGIFLPLQSPPHQLSGGYSVRSVAYMPTQTVPLPMASFNGLPFNGQMIHPLTIGGPTPVEASYVISRTAGSNGSEVHSSMNGVFHETLRSSKNALHCR